jgi:hypothetical protein
MDIPRAWVRVSGDGRSPDGRTVPVSVWGWGDDEPRARTGAADRLQRILDRIRRGEPIPHRYGYGSRPLREEILQTFDDALVTRNAYGAEVLNTARLLFLDIDLRPPTVGQRLRRMFGGASADDAALTTLRQTLQQYARATFRIYRTASGYRVMAIDRDFDPAAGETQELMRATATDPAFSQLCLAQRSFRARLTPKPWRCRSSPPPGEHPRTDGELRRRFASWLREYEHASARYATCHYLETIGTGRPTRDASRLQDLHDRTTRCRESLPLA